MDLAVAISEPGASAEPRRPGGALTVGDRAASEARFDAILRREGAALRRVAAAYEADPARREDLFQDVCLAR